MHAIITIKAFQIKIKYNIKNEPSVKFKLIPLKRIKLFKKEKVLILLHTLPLQQQYLPMKIMNPQIKTTIVLQLLISN